MMLEAWNYLCEIVAECRAMLVWAIGWGNEEGDKENRS